MLRSARTLSTNNKGRDMNSIRLILSTICLCSSLSLVGMKKKETVLFKGASKEFNNTMKSVTIGQSYSFICHLVKNKQKMMQNKIKETITLGRCASLFGLQKTMTTGMLYNEKNMADIFDALDTKKESSEKIKDKLESELKKTKNKALPKQTAQTSTNKILDFLGNNKDPVTNNIIKTFFPEEKKGSEGLITGFFATIKKAVTKNTIEPALKLAVKYVISSGVKQKEEWSEFFGTMAEKVYEKKIESAQQSE